MGINPSDAAATQAIGVHERQYFCVLCQTKLREPMKQRQDLRAAPQCSQRQFADDKRMAFRFSSAQKSAERGIIAPQVVHPD